MHALDTFSWKWKRLADLNIARFTHGSTSLGEATYVACGLGVRDCRDVHSVERLSMVSGSAETQAWTIINIPQLEPRRWPVFSQIGPDQLCILGGGPGGYDMFSDGVILNLNTQEVTAIKPASQIKFACFSESFLEKQGLLLCLVMDYHNVNTHLIRFNQAANCITSVHNYGRFY